MSEPAPETPKPTKRSAAKTAPVEAEVVEQQAEGQAANTQKPAISPTTVAAGSSSLIIHNRPSTWFAAAGVALLIFLFGYATGVAISHSRTMRHMQRPGVWRQEMRDNNYPSQNRGNNSNVPSV